MRELDSLLIEANYLFVFIPIINYIYSYSNSPSQRLLLIIAASCFICAFFFNFTRGYPDQDEGEDYDIPTAVGYVYIISVIIWIVLWGYSLVKLFPFIGCSRIVPDVLFVGSIAWALLLGTHLILDHTVNGYSNDIYKY